MEEKTADTEIAERAKRLQNIYADQMTGIWLRELTDEITRLRYELRAAASRTAKG